MIEFRSLTYSYPDSDRPALDDAHLSLAEGKVVAVLGRSGSGKSTLLWAVNGLVPHFYGGRYKGDVTVDGVRVRDESAQRLAEKVGTVFQEPARRFISNRVLDELAFGMEVAGLTPQIMRRRLEGIVAVLGLEPLLDRDPHRLSGGEQQRVALGAAMVRQPRVMLLDEPTSQLDRRGSKALFGWLEERRILDGLTTLVAEHRLDELARISDQAVYLDAFGRVAASGSMAEVLGQMPYAAPALEAVRLVNGSHHGVAGPSPSWNGNGQADEAAERRRATGGEVMIAKGLGFSYNGRPALRDAGLSVRRGSITAVVGHNGSGKTTLLRSLVGLCRPASGEVAFEGESIREMEVPDLARHVGYVPQWPAALLFSPSVRQELAFTLTQHPERELSPAVVEQVLRDLGLQEVADRYPRDLSAGQRQRAALGAILVARPEVLLLDEPTLGLDPIARKDLGRLLVDLATSGTGVVMATHDVEFAADFADRVMILDDGSTLAEGPTDETLFRYPAYRTSLQELTGRPSPAGIGRWSQATTEDPARHHAHD